MSENTKKSRESKAEEKEAPAGWSFLPFFVERLFETVEDFFGRLSDMASERAEEFITRVMRHLLALLLIGIGIVFLVSGAVQVINRLVGFPGIGQLVLGTITLLGAACILFFNRRQK